MAHLPPLKFAASDARKISLALSSSGWQTDQIRLLSTEETIPGGRPTKQAILDAIRMAALGDSVRSHDTMCFVFAGHGFSPPDHVECLGGDRADGDRTGV